MELGRLLVYHFIRLAVNRFEGQIAVVVQDWGPVADKLILFRRVRP